MRHFMAAKRQPEMDSSEERKNHLYLIEAKRRAEHRFFTRIGSHLLRRGLGCARLHSSAHFMAFRGTEEHLQRN